MRAQLSALAADVHLVVLLVDARDEEKLKSSLHLCSEVGLSSENHEIVKDGTILYERIIQEEDIRIEMREALGTNVALHYAKYGDLPIP